MTTDSTQSETPATHSRQRQPSQRAMHSGFWMRVAPGARGKLSRWQASLKRIAELGAAFDGKSDAELRKMSLALRYRAKSGERLTKILPEAFALVREAASRTVQMRHFDVQLLGGIAMAKQSIAEMATGEGKTLTATLPLYLFALAGKGVHLATANDYLAQRDADLMRPVYDLLGLTVGVIQSQDGQDQRRSAYACDITYGTANEIGFDFLRDRLLLRSINESRGGESLFTADKDDQSSEQPVGRGLHFVLVDEADSILIDEARTPLIIGTMGEAAKQARLATYRWAAQHAERFQETTDFTYDHKKKKVELTLAGRQHVRQIPRDLVLTRVGWVDLYQFTERAIQVRRDFQLDQHYVVRDGEVVIVDEFTGRYGEGRRWQAGIHQAIEAKEGIEITDETGMAARITIQDLFLSYRHLAGMTGTAITSAREFRKVYKKPVVPIPTNRPVQRKRLPNCIFGSESDKWKAVVEEVHQLHEQGRPILIGTRSIEKSEVLSEQLTAAEITHQVLNARQIAQEAEIVSGAGQVGKVTVATNMAGRGTDIKLAPAVRKLGGLHVILTEIHDSPRIDRQLIGRCGRQGDPGTFRLYLSLEDEILSNGFGPKRAKQLLKGKQAGSVGLRLFRRAQNRMEARHLRSRKIMLYQERKRQKMQRELGQDPFLDTAE